VKGVMVGIETTKNTTFFDRGIIYLQVDVQQLEIGPYSLPPTFYLCPVTSKNVRTLLEIQQRLLFAFY
jgi:hypothetical protein